MEIAYEGVSIQVSDKMRDSLVDFMRETCRLMRDADQHYADCWTHGRAIFEQGRVSPTIEYGNADYPGNDGLGEFAIVVEGKPAERPTAKTAATPILRKDV